jgi:hypothetical protein
MVHLLAADRIPYGSKQTMHTYYSPALSLVHTLGPLYRQRSPVVPARSDGFFGPAVKIAQHSQRFGALSIQNYIHRAASYIRYLGTGEPWQCRCLQRDN